MADMISRLPDHLLCDILSYVPTKLAATTSVLSKSWKSLWLSLPSLDLDDGIDDPSLRSFQDLKDNYLRFARFVDSLLITRYHQPIQRFRFKCAFCSNVFDISIWVNIAMHLSVKELELSLPSRSINFTLACNVFFSKAMVVIKLKNLIIHHLYFVSLPSLKILHLENVWFPDFECVSRLLSRSTALEDLVLKCCPIFIKERNLIILGMRNLSSVSLLSLKTLHLDSIFFPNCECFSKFLSCCIAVEDLVLKSVRIAIGERKWLEYESFPKLVRANIHCGIPLRVLYNVKFLQLWPFLYYEPADTPTFHNLVSLEVIFRNLNWKILMCMLHNSPMLQNLVIHQKYRCEAFSIWPYPLRVPGCISSQLKTCSLRGFDSNMATLFSGLPFVIYIMRNARVLQTMTIFCETPVTKHFIIEKLSSCERSSPTCEVVFE